LRAENTGLFKIQGYSKYRVIQNKGLFKIQGYSKYRVIQNTGLFKMIVGVLTTCHTQYT
jgi:hypothetical protein